MVTEYPVVAFSLLLFLSEAMWVCLSLSLYSNPQPSLYTHFWNILFSLWNVMWRPGWRLWHFIVSLSPHETLLAAVSNRLCQSLGGNICTHGSSAFAMWGLRRGCGFICRYQLIQSYFYYLLFNLFHFSASKFHHSDLLKFPGLRSLRVCEKLPSGLFCKWAIRKFPFDLKALLFWCFWCFWSPGLSERNYTNDSKWYKSWEYYWEYRDESLLLCWVKRWPDATNLFHQASVKVLKLFRSERDSALRCGSTLTHDKKVKGGRFLVTETVKKPSGETEPRGRTSLP